MYAYGGYPPPAYPMAHPAYARRDPYARDPYDHYGGRDSFAAGYARALHPFHQPRGDYRHSPNGFRGRGQRPPRGGQRGGPRGGRGQRGGSRGRGGARGRGRGGANVARDPKTGKKLNKQEVRQKAVEERRKQTGFFFFYEKKLRCCIKVVTKECPHILQPQPWDLLTIYDDPSYVDKTIDAPYMNEVEQQQQIKRNRIEKKFEKKKGLAKDGNGDKEKDEIKDSTEDDKVVTLTEDEKMEEGEKEKEEGEKEKEEGEKEEEGKEREETPPTQTLTLGSFLTDLASSEAASSEAQAPESSTEEAEKKEEKKDEAEKEKKPWVWPPPYTPRPLTKCQKKQKREVPQGLACMVSIPEQKRRKYNHSWVQVHKQKPWIEIPCIKRLVQRRDELKEEFEDLVKHLKWHPDDSEAVKKRNEVEKVFKRLRNRVHSFLKRLELQYMTAGNEGVQDIIAQFLEERQEEDGIEVIFKKEHDDAAAELLAIEEEAKRLEESKRPRDTTDDDAAETNGDTANGAGSGKRAKTDASDTNGEAHVEEQVEECVEEHVEEHVEEQLNSE